MADKKKQSPTVSVIIPAYNEEQYIADIIESILGQSFTDFELIIVDNGSTDSTYEIASSFTDPRIQVYKQKNAGPANARNKALQFAKGKYIAIHGAGDISYTNRIRKQVSFLEGNTDFGIVGCYSERLNSFNNETELHQPKKLSNHEAFFLYGEILFRREIYDLVSGYNGFYKYSQCTSLVRKIGKISQVGIIDEVLYKQVIYNDGVSKSPKKQFAQKVYSNIKKQIRSLSAADIDEYEYLPGVRNRRAIIDSYFTSLLVFGYVSLDKKFDFILKNNHNFLYFLSSSFLNTRKFKYLHVLFFPGCLIRAASKN